MKLSHPFIIGSRLLPAVKIGDTTVSITFSDRPGDERRSRYRYYIDGGCAYTNDDIPSGVGGGDLRKGMESLLSFLGATAESVQYATRTGKRVSETENGELFPPWVADWAAQHSDELSLAALEIEENPNCMEEE